MMKTTWIIWWCFQLAPPSQYQNEIMQTSQPELLFREILQLREPLVSSSPFFVSVLNKGGPVKKITLYYNVALYQVDCASSSVPLKRVTRKVTTPTRSFWIDLKILIGRQRRRTAAPRTKVECGWRGLFFLQVLQILQKLIFRDFQFCQFSRYSCHCHGQTGMFRWPGIQVYRVSQK